MEKIGLEAVLNDANFQAGLARYVAGLGKAEKSTQKTAGAMSAFGHTISTALGTAMGILTSQAIPQLIAGLGSFVSEAAAAEQGDAALEAVLKSTKGVAGLTAGAINDMATALSEVTPFEDDAIKGGQSLLLTFTNIGKNVFPEATEVMLDMSQALGQDLKSSAIQLGKALQDPKDGVSALQRVGVNFNDTQKKTIEQLVKAGKVEQAQKFILKELKTEFGGAAKAAGTTFAGQLKILNNQFGNIKEEIGTALLPVLKNMTGFISSRILPVFRKFASDIMPKVVGWIEKFASTLGMIFDNLSVNFKYAGIEGIFIGLVAIISESLGKSEEEIGSFIDALYGIGTAISEVVRGFQQGGLAGGLQAIGTQLTNAFKNIDWTSVSKNLDGLKTQFWTWLTGKGGVLQQVGAQLGSVVAAIADWLSNSKNTQPIVDAVLGWVWQFWQWITDPRAGLLATVFDKMEKLTETMRRWAESATTQKQLQEIGKTVARAVLTGIGRVFENPTGERGDLIGTLVASLGRGAAAQVSALSNIGASIGTGIINGIVSAITGRDMSASFSAWLQKNLKNALILLGGPWATLANTLFGGTPAPTTTIKPLPWGGTGEKFAEGGPVRRTGMALVHAGEYVLNRQQAMAWAPALASTSTVYNFNHTWPAAVPPSQREWTESMVRRVTQQEVRGILGKG